MTADQASDDTNPGAGSLRDRIAQALRDNDYHSCMYGEGIDAGDLADAVLIVVLGTDIARIVQPREDTTP